MGTKIKQIPAEDRPRERLVRLGANSLSTIELIAILLGSGTKEKSALDLASEILSTFKDLKKLSLASIEELEGIKGMGRAKAIRLKAAFAVGVSINSAEESRVEGNTTDKIYQKIKNELESKTVESLMVILLDCKGYIFHQEIISVGTLSEVMIHPREVFYPAIRQKASSIILAHNHVSGDPTPSISDLRLQKNLSKLEN